MSHIKGVIFDWAGTTVDFGSLSPVSAFIEAFRRHGIEVTENETRIPMGLLKRDHIRTMLAMPRISTLWQERYGRAPTHEDIETLYADFEPSLMSVLSQHCDIKPGVLETIETLRLKGIKIGSTTGFTSRMLAVVGKEARQNGYYPDAAVTADDVHGFGRPWPYMIFRNMEILGLDDVRDIVKVGDTVSDIKEAAHAGIRSIGVTEGSSLMGLSHAQWHALSEKDKALANDKTRSLFFNAGADFVIRTMNELPLLLESIPPKRASL